jgi:mono/diheme cytochrome c family protein
VWEYAGLDAPALREVLLAQMPPQPTPQPAPAEDILTYSVTIGPLLESRCGSCHGPNGLQGLDLTSYAGIMAGGEKGPAVIPGDAYGSLLVQKQTAQHPHFAQLTTDELKLVIQWITDGAVEK